MDQILARDASGLYYHQDRLGNVSAVTNGNGEVIEQYRYDAFGQPEIRSGPVNGNPNGELNGTAQNNVTLVNNRFLFTGREWAAAYGFYEYRNRAYNPRLGRFMSEDPKGFAAGDRNLFRYCGGDPVNRVDPMGLEDVPLPRKWIELGVRAALNARQDLIDHPGRGPGRTQSVIPGPNGPILQKGFDAADESLTIVHYGRQPGSNVPGEKGRTMRETSPRGALESGHVHDDANVAGKGNADPDFSPTDEGTAAGVPANQTKDGKPVKGSPIFKALSSDPSIVEYLNPQKNPGEKATKHYVETGYKDKTKSTSQNVEPDEESNKLKSRSDGTSGYDHAADRFKK